MNGYVVVLAAVVAAAAAEVINFSDCGSATGSVEQVDVSPCPSQPCILTKGQSSSIKISFKSKVNTPKLQAKVYGVLFGLPVPWPLPDENACTAPGVTCPVSNGDALTYDLSMKVPLIAPDNLQLLVRFVMLDQRKQKLVCMQFPALIKPKP